MGAVGAVLAPTIVVVGSLTVIAAIQRRFPDAGALRSGRIFLAFDGLSLWLFGALVLAALRWAATLWRSPR